MQILLDESWCEKKKIFILFAAVCSWIYEHKLIQYIRVEDAEKTHAFTVTLAFMDFGHN